ncbi:GGDEF domain-containing protein [Actinosynnema sp. NPDC020468]|uniref:GGDEF domain-containing protein n=1 Tax=Actinosynnema sp. NPDC020468 TaxID=3154488 RepID=UPI0033C76582
MTTGVLLVATAVVLLVVTGVLPREHALMIDKFAQLAFATAALACFWSAARRRHGTARRWRLWMVAAMAGLVVGMSAWIWGQIFLGVSMPSTTVAPLGFLLVPILTLFAVLVLGHGGGSGSLPGRRSRVVIVLDGLIVVGSLFVLTWVSLLESIVRAWAASGPGFATVVAHPAAYLVTLVVLLVSSWTHRSVRQLPVLFVALGCVAQSSSGWAFAFLVSRQVTAIPTAADIGFMVAPALFFLASVAPGHNTREHSTGRLRAGELLHLLVPYLPMLVTGLFIVVGTATGVRLNALEIYVGLGVVLLVIARQLLTLIDNVRLLEQLRDSRERLRHQAYHDPLTGVANRSLFRERLDLALAGSEPVVVLFIDVDGFKHVNDNFGHAEGDAVLRIVAKRLQGCVRAQDTVARLGGDEFGVLVDGYPLPPEEIGNRVLEALKAPHRTGIRRHTIHASVGVSHRLSADSTLTADDLLGSADAAMYTAKRLGKGMVVVHGSVEAELP